jgi:hypothetical protein
VSFVLRYHQYIERIALKCQVVAVREGGTECVQNVAMKWKEKGATLKSMEGPAAHPLNRDSSEAEMTECVNKWYVDIIVIDGKGEMRGSK